MEGNVKRLMPVNKSIKKRRNVKKILEKREGAPLLEIKKRSPYKYPTMQPTLIERMIDFTIIAISFRAF